MFLYHPPSRHSEELVSEILYSLYRVTQLLNGIKTITAFFFFTLTWNGFLRGSVIVCNLLLMEIYIYSEFFIWSFCCFLLFYKIEGKQHLKQLIRVDSVQVGGINFFCSNSAYNPYIFSACFFQGEIHTFGWPFKM